MFVNLYLSAPGPGYSSVYSDGALVSTVSFVEWFATLKIFYGIGSSLLVISSMFVYRAIVLVGGTVVV